VLQLLGLRQLAVARALERRGHAGWQPIDGGTLTPPAQALDTAGEGATRAAQGALLTEAVWPILREARGHPEWSSIGVAPVADPRRDVLVARLAALLDAAL